MIQSRSCWQRVSLYASALLLLALTSRASLFAATLPAGFTEALVASGLSNPTAMQFAPDGRLFVTQQGGALRVIKNGTLLAAPFLTLTVDANGERGLLGVAFDPNFVANQHVYVYYTVPAGPGVMVHNRISRFTANGDVAVPGSEFVVVDLDNLSGATNHNGGAIDFGPDGKLYVAVGDNATSPNAQTLSNRHGKMLRLNADGSIPTDNPFYGTASGANRAIWALGLRNPFTFALNPGGSPGMLINDVGQGSWEEVNPGTAGANFGWPATSDGDFDPTQPANSGFTRPRYAYPNDSSTCAITGGAFYPAAAANFPAQYRGMYFFADFCAGWIRVVDPNLVQPFPLQASAATDFASGISNPVDLKVGSDGALYYLARGQGRVYRVSYGGTPTTPTGLAALVNGASVRLTWNRVAGATSYRIEAGSASGLANLVNADLGDVNAFEGLVPPGRYFVRVRGVTGGSVTGPSNQVTVDVTTTAACVTAPPVPTGVTAQSGGLLARFAWSPSASATGYVLDVGRSAGVVEVSLPLGAGTSFQTVAPAGTYFARVRALNGCGASAASSQVSLTLACTAGAVVPTGFAVSNTGGTATFSWQGAFGATGYRLRVGTVQGASDVADIPVGIVTSLAVPLAGVAPRVYHVRVVAESACGVGAASNEVALTVP
jgi:glucose/arabinose dehydrogenase